MAAVNAFGAAKPDIVVLHRNSGAAVIFPRQSMKDSFGCRVGAMKERYSFLQC